MAKDTPIQFKGTMIKIIQAQLRSADTATLHAALAELTGNAPDFFDNDLAVLDFSAAENLPAKVDWAAIAKLFRQSGLSPVATCGLPAAQAAAASKLGLPETTEEAFSRPQRASAPAPRPEEVPPPPAAQPVAPPPAPEPVRTLIVDRPLRSGQRVYAQGGDLVVMAMVSAGAEVIADGNIHVYAPLRGRALAGASGDHQARIFATNLQAELVSIAGVYRTFENGVPTDVAGKHAVVSLSGDNESKLSIVPLTVS